MMSAPQGSSESLLDTATQRLKQLADRLRQPGQTPQTLGYIADDVMKLAASLGEIDLTVLSAQLGAEASNETGPTAQDREPALAIIRSIAAWQGVSVRDVVGPSRTLAVVRARQYSMWVAYQILKLSYPRLGRIFNRDHTTVMHAIKRVDERRLASKELRAELDNIVMGQRAQLFGGLNLYREIEMICAERDRLTTGLVALNERLESVLKTMSQFALSEAKPGSD